MCRAIVLNCCLTKCYCTELNNLGLNRLQFTKANWGLVPQFATGLVC